MNKSLVLDQFFTNPSVSKDCFSIFSKTLFDLNISGTWLEPSAGNGSFFNLMPNPKLGIDLDKKLPDVIQSDFLSYPLDKSDYITLGNPPFGKNSSLAIKFFNKCANHSSIIGFIVPKTFKKDSVINKLNPYFHLLFQKDLDKNSFLLDNSVYDVPCTFQIWLKKDTLRPIIPKISTIDDFIFTSKNLADFAIQRVGVAAGKIKLDFSNYSSSSHYFIKSKSDFDILPILNSIDFSSVKFNTAGNPSISKSELIKLYIQAKNNLF
jgi:hypothetical protein